MLKKKDLLLCRHATLEDSSLVLQLAQRTNYELIQIVVVPRQVLVRLLRRGVQEGAALPHFEEFTLGRVPCWGEERTVG